eukprot:CAMPEP_0167831768 /NCGR_PEP_ID=MMETSP0112_2-20121227/13884_1 /TAXON_ID=91324 /ORGANISM="Lotharella globosa, Strain CCCM811" /LENGTH=92 /DNA_ID=CAMNT_0007736581 /DNA_START=745 /DNA_END=1023 /DNA_ORIENTATION=+
MDVNTCVLDPGGIVLKEVRLLLGEQRQQLALNPGTFELLLANQGMNRFFQNRYRPAEAIAHKVDLTKPARIQSLNYLEIIYSLRRPEEEMRF